MTKKYIIPHVAADAIMEAVEGICYKGGFTAKDAENYLQKSSAYVIRALIASEQLGFTTCIDSKYDVSDEAKDVSRANKKQWPFIFRKFLQRYIPFTLFVALIGKGNTPQDAARKIKIICDIDTSPKIIEIVMLGWGEYSQILKRNNGKIELQIKIEELSAEYIEELLEAMRHDIKSRTYIANKVGGDVFNYLHEDEVDLFVKSIREHQSDPRDAIDDCGRAFEDILRRIGTDKKVPMNNCKGIQELADTLKGALLIDVKHLDGCKAINVLRVAAAHNKDRNSVKRWNLSPDAAIECVLFALTLIRSIYNYVFNQIQMF